MKRTDGTRGERRLLLAIVLDAVRRVIDGATDPRRRNARDVVEARAWLRQDDVFDESSFINIAELLDLDVDRIRAALAASLREIAGRGLGSRPVSRLSRVPGRVRAPRPHAGASRRRSCRRGPGT